MSVIAKFQLLPDFSYCQISVISGFQLLKVSESQVVAVVTARFSEVLKQQSLDTP